MAANLFYKFYDTNGVLTDSGIQTMIVGDVLVIQINMDGRNVKIAEISLAGETFPPKPSTLQSEEPVKSEPEEFDKWPLWR